MATPFLIFGDAPGQPSGLARILTDVATRLETAVREGVLDLDLAVCGYAPWVGLARQGQPAMHVANTLPPRNWVFSDFESRGAYAVQAAWRYYFGIRPGIVLSIWDPARVEALAQASLPIRRWGYFPIDAETPTGKITGPAGDHLRSYERVLAYTKFGSRILGETLQRAVPYIYHGLDQAAFTVPSAEEITWAMQQVPARPQPVFGCVATNQRRKYLPLFFELLQMMSPEVYGWLHTDRLVADAWSIPQLAEDFGVSKRLTVTLGSMQTPVRAIYDRCAVTIAPGRGEGFGYPIAESLAQGTPVVHVNYAGGAEITPARLRAVYDEYEYEGVYNLRRPVLALREWGWLVQQQLLEGQHPAHREWCRAQVQHLHWDRIWPQWLTWIQGGL